MAQVAGIISLFDNSYRDMRVSLFLAAARLENQCTNGAAPRRRHALSEEKSALFASATAAAAHLSTLAQELASRGRKVSAHSFESARAAERQLKFHAQRRVYL
jgi:hypothetical protein